MARQDGSPGIMRFLRARRWRLVAPTLLLMWVIGQIDKTHISLIIADGDFLRELQLVGRNAELGGLMSSFIVGYGLSIFVWGFLVDRFGPRVCAIGGTACWGVVLYMSSWVGSIEEYFAIRFLLGAAEGNLWPVCNVLTNRWFPAREHSRVQAFWLTGSTLGTAVGVPVVTFFMLASGWRGALEVLGILSLLPIIFLYFVRNWPREQRGLPRRELEEIESGRRANVGVEPMSFRELLKSPSFWLIALCQVVSATTIFTLIHWLPSFFTVFRQVPFQGMADVLFVGYLLATAFTLGVGYIADRTMQRALTGAWVSLFFVFAILPGALLLPPAGSALLLASLIAVAASSAALQGALMHTLVRPEAIARGTGVYVGVGIFTSALGPVTFGFLINALSGQYWGGFLFLALLNGVGAGCFFTLHRISNKVIQAASLPATVRKGALAASESSGASVAD